ncbi:MAG: hypothetical protein ACFFBP_01280 [Promethearchaeota archaeon]
MTNFSISWLNGISTLLLICVAFFLVIDSTYYYIKLKNKTYLGGILLFGSIGVGWLGITLSFLAVEFTGTTPNWIEFLIPFFSYSTLPIGCFAIVYIVWELVASTKTRKNILIIYILLGITYYLIFFLSLYFIEGLVRFHDVYGEVMDDWAAPGTLFYFSIWIFTTITSTFTLIGFGKMRQKTAGELKARSTVLMISSPIFALCILADTVILGSLIHDHYNYLFIVRLLMMLSLYMIMIGFRPTSLKPTILSIPVLITIFIIFGFFIGLENGV